MPNDRHDSPADGANPSDIESKVAARAAEIEAKAAAKEAPSNQDVPLDKHFVLDCLSRNRVGDAALFCALFRGKYVFVQEWEKFLYWTGNYWSVDMRNRHALADSERVCEAYQNAWAQAGDEEGSSLHKLLVKRLRVLRSHAGRKEMLDCVTTIDGAPVISVEDLDKQPYLLATPTGVIDLRTGECNPGKPEQYLTSHCPTPWKGLDAPSPDFQKYLLTCMAEDQEIADFIVHLLGYGLLGDKERGLWAIMYGPLSRNGKDTLMNVLQYILGNKLHVRFNTNMLIESKFQRDSSQPQTDLMALRGARIAYGSEANARQRLDQTKIKDMTGGGTITARGNNDKEMSQWKQNALLLLLTNYLPKLDASDDGFNARTICIEWPVKFVSNPTKDYERQIVFGMAKKLEAEASGILALLVRGCMDVIANGLTIPDKVLKFTRDQIDSFDDIGNFLKECCLMEDPPTGGRQYETRIAASDLLKVCNWWCKNILGNAYPYTPKKLTLSLEKKGIQTKKSSVTFYLGLTIKPDVMAEYEEDQLKQEEKRRNRS